jgi:hypothetical protein
MHNWLNFCVGKDIQSGYLLLQKMNLNVVI